jgi:uracil-DNA glycosylase
MSGPESPSLSPPHDPLATLREQVIRCRACPRLVEWREKVAREKRAAFRDEDYWGRPVPGFGDPHARLLIVGLAPAAHGANRTGRMFTGDRSGDWLFGALHRAGFASRPSATHRDDGLRLQDAFLTATLRCAPPGNRPRPAERKNCRPFLEAEFDHFLPRIRCVVALGGYAWGHVLRILRDRGLSVPSPRPSFGHGAEVSLAEGPTLLASYHPSQQNTFTGTLTEKAFDEVWARARELVGGV